MFNLKNKILFLIRKTLFQGKTIRKGAYIHNSILGEWVHIANFANIVESNIGRYTSVGRFSNVYYTNIGAFCSISWNVTIGAVNHPINHITTHAFPYIKMFDISDSNERKKIRTDIGNDVWIGAGAIILPGVKIGNGAIIGAGCVVTKDVEPYTIVAGNPAKKLRDRFPEEIKELLEEIKWWNWEKQLLKKYLYLFRRPLTNEVVEELKKVYKNEIIK